MTPKAFHALFGRIGIRAGMPFPVHPHMLRHGCGYALANAGHDTRALQAYLGHKNIQHTVRYTELAPGSVQELLALTSPPPAASGIRVRERLGLIRRLAGALFRPPGTLPPASTPSNPQPFLSHREANFSLVERHQRSQIMSRLRCSSVRLNSFTASASAAFWSGASMVPRLWARARMIAIRQLRSLAPTGFFFGGLMLSLR
jgi:hypothetical protein